LHGGEDAHGRLRSHASHPAQRIEDGELVGIGEAEQAEVVLAHDKSGTEGGFRADTQAQGMLRGHLDGEPHSPNLNDGGGSGAGQNGAAHR
jgi:hypothetical protein